MGQGPPADPRLRIGIFGRLLAHSVGESLE